MSPGPVAGDPIKEDASELVKQLQQAKQQIEAERRRAAGYQEELKSAKEHHFLIQKQVEQEEEFLVNKLSKRLNQLKREKQTLANEVEQEEEYLVNNLQKRLAKVNMEKEELERRLEAETEYVVNKVKGKLEELARERVQLSGEKAALQAEKADLKAQVTDLAAAVQKINREKVHLEQTLEAEEEQVVNRLQRELEAVVRNYHVLEHRLEAAGISVSSISQLEPISTNTEWVYGRSPSRSGAHRERSLSASSGASRRSSINETSKPMNIDRAPSGSAFMVR